MKAFIADALEVFSNGLIVICKVEDFAIKILHRYDIVVGYDY